MNLFKRVFGTKQDAASLPPLVDPVLGELRWDKDVEEWAGTVAGTNPPVRVFIASGSDQVYPSDQARALLRAPYQDFAQISRTALAYLRDSGVCRSWNVDPDTFAVTGLESYAHSERAYTITLADAGDTAIWRVNFENGQPASTGVDD